MYGCGVEVIFCDIEYIFRYEREKYIVVVDEVGKVL